MEREREGEREGGREKERVVKFGKWQTIYVCTTHKST